MPFRRMARVQPFAPDHVPHNLGFSLLLAGKYTEAHEVLSALEAKGFDRPWFEFLTHRTQIILAVFDGRPDDAQRRAAAFHEKYGDRATIARLTPLLSNLKDKDSVDRMIEALREAGIPEAPEG